MTHHHLRFDLLHSLKRNAYKDYNRGTAHHKSSHVGEIRVDEGNNGNKRKEECADKCDLRKDLCYIIRRRLTRTDTSYRTVVLTEIV